MVDVDAVRRLFPHTQRSVYFNVASNGPQPDPAFMRLDDQFQTFRLAEVGDQADLFAALGNIRRNGARIFGCKKSEVGFGFNTTFGLNLAAFGLPLKRGDEIILSNAEFPANVYPWLELRNRGIGVTFVESDNGFFNIARVTRAITRRTRVLSLSFVQYFNGYKADMEAIGALCRRHNIFLVIDAIQGAGCEPMHVRKWNVAVASAGGQKWLLSPQGTGIYYVSEEIQPVLRPPWRSWLSIDWHCRWHDLRRFNLTYESSARQYELGTYPTPLVMAFDWALDYLAGLGIGSIQRHNHALLDILITYLRGNPFYRITSSLERKHRSSILSFTTDQADVREVHGALLAEKIITSLREGAIRVSAHLYNDRSEIDRLIAVLDKTASTVKRK